jgi:hypothetical protein
MYGMEVSMQTKLTVRVNDQLIQSAKRYARRRGISLSRLIENYLSALAVEQDDPIIQTPILQRLSGILPENATLGDQHRHWEEKYG